MGHAIFNVVVKSSAFVQDQFDFAGFRTFLTEGGVERLIYIVREEKFVYKVRKYASTVSMGRPQDSTGSLVNMCEQLVFLTNNAKRILNNWE